MNNKKTIRQLEKEIDQLEEMQNYVIIFSLVIIGLMFLLTNPIVMSYIGSNQVEEKHYKR